MANGTTPFSPGTQLSCIVYIFTRPKRVVGLSGDTIELRNEALYLNGTRLEYAPLPTDHHGADSLEHKEKAAALFARESLGTHRHAVMALPAVAALRDFGPVTVPAGQYFVMGDNRDNSHDSRYFGFVPRREIIGEAKGVFVSADPAHWLRPRFDRFFTALE